ncbi:acyl-CoA dehydrogenase [bacterium]|nr:acyl-CoA dehydrogenase [bacterium]
MTYLANLNDLEFNLFEFLDISKILALTPYADHSVDMYKMVLSEALKFTKDTLGPLNPVGDKQGTKLENGMVKVPDGFKEAFHTYAQNGFIGMDVNPEWGGQGLPLFITAACCEFFSGANYSFFMYPGLTRGSAHLIETFGTQALARKFCHKMYAGEYSGTMCLTEPQAGSGLGDIKTSATPQEDGTYLIRGNKIFISGGDQNMTDNIIHLVLARVVGDAQGTKGISLFAVPKIWVNEDGSLDKPNDVSCVNVEHKMGIKASATCSLNFGEKGTCRGYLVGEQSKGMSYMFQMMNEARIMVGVQGMAIASSVYLNALNYARDRTQGGNTIVNHPDVRRNLMYMKAISEGLRAMLMEAAFMGDVAKYSNDAAQKAKAQNRIDLLTPVYKAYSSDMGFKATEIAMQVYGGYGYISEYPIEQYMRDAKIASLYEGTNGIQALDLLARKLPSKNGEMFRELYEEISAFASSLSTTPELEKAGKALKEANDTLGSVVMKFAEWGMGGDRITPQLGATPFLEICGHVVVTYVLLRQAVVCLKKTGPAYTAKIQTALFFVDEFLPLVRARAKSIINGSKIPMDVEF